MVETYVSSAPPDHTDAMSFGRVESHIALWFGSHRIGSEGPFASEVLRLLFTPKSHPHEVLDSTL